MAQHLGKKTIRKRETAWPRLLMRLPIVCGSFFPSFFFLILKCKVWNSIEMTVFKSLKALGIFVLIVLLLYFIQLHLNTFSTGQFVKILNFQIYFTFRPSKFSNL